MWPAMYILTLDNTGESEHQTGHLSYQEQKTALNLHTQHVLEDKYTLQSQLRAI